MDVHPDATFSESIDGVGPNEVVEGLEVVEAAVAEKLPDARVEHHSETRWPSWKAEKGVFSQLHRTGFAEIA